jgi:autotransporter translocation and assembly factor TamB
VTKLQVEQNRHTLGMAASWKAGQLILSNIALTHDDATLLSGNAQVPLDPNVRSLDDFFAQQGTIAAALTADKLPLVQVHDLLPGLKFNGAGMIFGTLALSGTLGVPVADAVVEIRSLTAIDFPAVAPMDVFAKLHHSDSRLVAESRVVQQDATIFNLEASLPLATSVRSLKDLFAQNGEVSLALQSSRLSIAQVRPLLTGVALPEAGNVTSDIAVAGSFADPTLTATLNATGLSGGPLGATPPTDLTVKLTSADKRLNISGSANQPNAPPARLSGSMGFRPQRWLDNPQMLAEETLDLRITIQGLNARQLVTNIPGVADFSLLLDADVTIDGPLNAPGMRGAVAARDGRLRPKNDSLPTISGLRMDLRFDGRKATLRDLSMTHAGGTLSLRGTADFATLKNPLLDLTLTGNQALLWRDDSMNARANAALRLVGPFDAATLSGSLAVVETLYYRDLEVIPTTPFRAPRKRAVVARVDDIIDPEKAANRWNIPVPLNNWLVDVRLVTQDPILLRGDRIGGSIAGDIRARGTLGNPQLDGTAVLTDAKVRLPFSTLEVPRGTLTFTPERGFDPILELRGTSRISPYDVTIFVSGSAAKPDVLLTSDPPLPENEILSLLATGATTGDLGTEALTLKAAQLFIEQIRRSRLPFGRQIGEFIGILEEIDIRIGANDPYTGRKLSSATVGITDRVLISVAIDEEGNSRGVLMYLFRFR